MIVSTTNVAKNATITATPDNSLQDINVITDGDYSSVYTDSLSGNVSIEFTFATPQEIGYLAIGGSNISKLDTIKITTADTTDDVFLIDFNGDDLYDSNGDQLSALFVSTIDDSALAETEARTMMYQTDLTGVTSITVFVEGSGGISISEIAMGEYYTVPKGEQSGYNRPWTVPNITARSTVGLDNAPVNLSYEGRDLQCTLTVPNNIMADFDGWYKFLEFAASNTFYILEDSDKFHSYACFNAVPRMTTANANTRSLGSSSIRFNAHAKSTGVSF